jgi:hypothetical protein
MGVRFPLPAPSILFIFSGFARIGAPFSDTSGAKWGTAHILRIFNRLSISGTYPSPATIHIVSVVYAQLRNARRTIGPFEANALQGVLLDHDAPLQPATGTKRRRS